MRAGWLGAWTFLLALTLPGSAGRAGKEDRLDPAKLAGTWTFVSGEKDGEKLDREQLKDVKVLITPDTITLEGPSGKSALKYTLDPGKSPATISMRMTEGPAKGAT